MVRKNMKINKELSSILGRGVKCKFMLIGMLVMLLSVSAVNAAELSNITADSDVLSLDISHDGSIELLGENEKSVINTTEDYKSNTLCENNNISDFNSGEYDVNISALSNDFISLGSNIINNDVAVSICDPQSGILQSNNGVSASTGTVNLISSNTYAPIYSNNLNTNPTMKAKYDLRDDGYVSSVKNQSGNSCWAHAALSALESCILKATGVEYDFSEVRLSKLADEYLVDDGHRNGKGNIYYSIGYLTSWLGAVKENFNPNNPVNLINIQNIYIISSENFESDVKNAILKYGAVVACFYSSDTNLKDQSNYYCNYNNDTNHEITIVGWDDNYNKNNFKDKPQDNGAWICKNSYGDQWGDNGYFYLSYYDKTLDKQSSYTFILNDSTKYNKNYQYDIQKISSDFDSKNYSYYKNIFTSTENENLVAVSSYFDKHIKYEISIKVNGNQVHRQTFNNNISGYFTVKLSKSISIKKGQQFEVIIHNCNNSHFEICVQNAFTKNLSTRVSQVSKDGKNWAWTSNYVCCIKAFTTTTTNLKNRPTVIANDLTKYYKGSEKLTVKLTDAVNNNVDITINGATYHRKVTNGVMSMNINLESGNYTTIITYSDSNFVFKVMVLVTVKSTIVASDITKYYRNGTQYYATFYDTEGNLLRNTVVSFNINGVFYNRTTNESGVAKLNINLAPDNCDDKNYIITAVHPVNGEQHSNNITVKSILQAKDLKMHYKDGSKFEVNVLDGMGNSVGSGKSVTFNINGVFYTRTTDSNGVARLNINLQVGTYVITSTYNGQNIANNIIIQP